MGGVERHQCVQGGNLRALATDAAGKVLGLRTSYGAFPSHGGGNIGTRIFGGLFEDKCFSPIYIYLDSYY